MREQKKISDEMQRAFNAHCRTLGGNGYLGYCLECVFATALCGGIGMGIGTLETLVGKIGAGIVLVIGIVAGIYIHNHATKDAERLAVGLITKYEQQIKSLEKELDYYRKRPLD